MSEEAKPPVPAITRIALMAGLFLLGASALNPPAAYGRDSDSPVVEKLRIEGNKALDAESMKLLMYTRATPWHDFLPGISRRRFDRRVFEADLQRIVSRYTELGYVDVQVDTSLVQDGDRIGIHLRITENQVVRVTRIEIRGLPEDLLVDSTTIKDRLQIVEGGPLERVLLEKDRGALRHILEDAGYAFASIHMQIERSGYLADVGYHVDPGPVCRIGRILVEGNERVGQSTVRRGITIRPGQPYRRSELLDSQLQLYRSGAFRSVSLGVPDSVDHSSPVDVLVSVRERAPRVLKLGGGYSHPEEKVRGQVIWQHRNFQGGARQFTLDSEASALRARGTASLRQPYIFGSKTWFTVSAFAEQDFPEEVRVKRLGGSTTLERVFGPTTRVFFQFRTDLVDFKADSTRTNFIVGFQRDTRDDFFDPSRGAFGALRLEESGVLFRSRQELVKITGEGRWYRRTILNSVIALRLKGGVIQEVAKGREVPNFERFFGGGANSVRGWELNQLSPRDASGNAIGGLSQIEGSIELRTKFHRLLGTALFLDAGHVADNQAGIIDMTQMKFAGGFGFRYLSPIGPVRLDFAYRLTEDPNVEDRQQIYLSLGQAF